MADVTLKRVDEIEAYAGPRAIPGIRMRPAARALGITAWGMNVIDLDAGTTRYPEHDHDERPGGGSACSFSGSATLHAGGEEWPLAPATLVRVGPGEKRKIVPGPDGARVPALGATPGKAYEPRR